MIPNPYVGLTSKTVHKNYILFVFSIFLAKVVCQYYTIKVSKSEVPYPVLALVGIKGTKFYAYNYFQ